MGDFLQENLAFRLLPRMKLVTFVNTLDMGGTEKAACHWAGGLKARGHEVVVLTLKDGLRHVELDAHGVETVVVAAAAELIAAELKRVQPEIIHVHAPGQPHIGDVLGQGLALLPKIPAVQTNIFGQLQNPQEDAWTDFRLFISWTSCVQAARRVFQPLDENFFRRASVAVYPVAPVEPPRNADIQAFRRGLGVGDEEVLLGRLSRPEPNKWSNLAVDAFRLALRRDHSIKLLLREPPPSVAARLRASPDARHFIILPATTDAAELRLTVSAFDVALHTSSIGESFGYGIAEPMNLGRPVITHSVPWQDQAQIELVRHGECGFVASTPAAMAAAILRLAKDASLRREMGIRARQHIRTLADSATSVTRLESVLHAGVERRANPFAVEDLKHARETAAYLDAHQFGHSWGEQLALRPFHYRVRFHQWRRSCRSTMRG